MLKSEQLETIQKMKVKTNHLLMLVALCFSMISLVSCGDDDDIKSHDRLEVEDTVLPEGVSSLSTNAVTLLVDVDYTDQAYFYVYDRNTMDLVIKILALSYPNNNKGYTYTARVSELEPNTEYSFKLVSATKIDLTKMLWFKTKTEGAKAGGKSVDLGLSVDWANCNVGASSPEDCGGYYAWGELTEKNEYLPATSLTYQRDIYDFSGDDRYDVAAKLWGNGWRMPTFAEFEELRDNCVWKWTILNNIQGYKVTGKNGASIFIPAAGYHYSVTLKHWQTHGVYWSSSPKRNGSTNTACYFTFDNSGFGMFGLNRYDGMSIRPVRDHK